MPNLHERILGTALGAAVGDALGCPFEFQSRAAVVQRLGETPWIDALYPIQDLAIHPLGIWDESAACGIGTDDTRMSWLLQQVVSENGRATAPEALARRYRDVYLYPQDYFPSHPELARQNLAYFIDAASGVLGQTSPANPQATQAALASGALGVGIPTLLGMISLPCAGCLELGNPEAAYRRAFALSFMDVGYARDVTAVMATLVALFGSGAPLAQAIELAFAINPFGVDPSWRERIAGWLKDCAHASSDRELCAILAKACWGLHPFDPVGALGTALCCLVHAAGDFERALLLSVNQWELGPGGEPQRMRDVDCIGSITGALCGAYAGSAAIPQRWLAPCRAANLAVYGFDIVQTAENFSACLGAA